MIKALIFDFDGTLLDTETPEFHAWQQVYRELGTELALADWLEGIGTWYAFDPYKDLEQKVGRPIDRAAIKKQMRTLHYDVVVAMELRAGVLPLLNEAQRRDLKLAVASSSSHAWVDEHLARYDLLMRFDAIKCRDDVAEGRSKPFPDLYLEVLRALGIAAREAIAFEDSLNGLRAAKAAGIYVVAVANDITKNLPLGEADLLVHSFEEVSLEVLMTRFAQTKNPTS
jgi:HAD superfamily hydrolase (TIGR01509 family)